MLRKKGLIAVGVLCLVLGGSAFGHNYVDHSLIDLLPEWVQFALWSTVAVVCFAGVRSEPFTTLGWRLWVMVCVVSMVSFGLPVLYHRTELVESFVSVLMYGALAWWGVLSSGPGGEYSDGIGDN